MFFIPMTPCNEKKQLSASFNACHPHQVKERGQVEKQFLLSLKALIF